MKVQIVTLAALGAACAFVAGLYILIQRHQRVEEQSSLLRAAKAHSLIISDFRSFYSTEVLSRIADQDVQITHEYKELVGAVPLPATLTIDFAEFVATEDRDIQLELLSDYPFPWRERAGLAEFPSASLAAFRAGDFSDKTQIIETDDGTFFQYAAPVAMSESCVSCHNNHESSPKMDWKVGDIRGVQVMTLPVQSSAYWSSPSAAQSTSSFRDIILFVSVFFVFSFVTIFLGQRRISRAFQTINQLAASERQRSYELESSRSKIHDVATRLDAVMQNISDAIVTTDTEGRIETVNKGALRVFEETEEGLVGAQLASFIRSTENPEGPLGFRNMIKAAGQKWASNKPTLFGLRSNGETFPLQLSISEVDFGSQGIYSVVIRDITEQVAYESQLRTVNEEAKLLSLVASRTDNAVIITDPDGLTEWVNEGFTRITGYTLEDVMGRRPGTILQGPETDKAAIARIGEAVRSGSSFSEVLINYTKDGRPYWVALESQPVFDEQGKLSNFIAIERDVTDAKEREEELEQAWKSAQKANSAKSEFLANMSHEIRTPMNGIIGMAGLLLSKPLEEEQRAFTNTIRDSGEALLTVINDILDFSKMDAGKLEFEDTDFELTQLVEGAVEITWPRAWGKDVDLLYYVPAEFDQTFVGDYGRLRQVLLNLLGNAVKFTETGCITVEVMPAETLEGVRFEVRDTGVGIPDQQLENLFESFSQVDSSPSRKFEGTGLGLAISKKIVSLMKGSIGVVSKEGAGSTFWFEIPLSRKTATAPQAESAEELRTKRILLIDEQELTGTLLKRMIGRWGFTVEQGRSTKEAVECLRNQSFDLVVLHPSQSDEMTPHLLRFVQSLDGPPVKTILIGNRSISGQSGDSAVRLDIDRRVEKPFQPATLRAAMAQLVLPEDQVRNGSCAVPEVIAEEPRITLPQKRILVVEDNAINQKVAEGILKSLGQHVDVAANGREAIRALSDFPYDLVLMDVQMPEMDGFEATREIRALPSGRADVRIIALTANAMTGDKQRCLDAGMDDYLAKPIKASQLRECLEHYFGGEAMPADHAPVPLGQDKGADLMELDQSVIAPLVARIGKERVQDILDAFFVDANSRLENIDLSLKDKDCAALQAQAHSIKGSAASLGLCAVAKAASTLEKGASGHDADEHLGSSAKDLKKAIQSAHSAVAQQALI